MSYLGIEHYPMRDERWFVFRGEDEDGSTVSITIGPVRDWVKMHHEFTMLGEKLSLDLVAWFPDEPSEDEKEAINDGLLDGRARYT